MILLRRRSRMVWTSLVVSCCSGQRACRTARVCRKWCGTCSQLPPTPNSASHAAIIFHCCCCAQEWFLRDPYIEYQVSGQWLLSRFGMKECSRSTPKTAPPLPQLRPLSSPARLRGVLNAAKPHTRRIPHLATLIALAAWKLRNIMRPINPLRC
jgi:hypothetical protein